jgi:lipopolysaccharide export system protein LptA
MTLSVYRRLLAATALLLSVVVTGMYFYARFRARNVLKELPHKIGYDIKQTANGFQFSKSDGKRTLFTIQARDVKEFRLNGRAELHNVSITLYGRDSSRFDRIYGEDFAWDPKTGEVTANGDVQIDLVANPAGLTSADQSTPRDIRNPIHLRTRDLVFNRDTGNAQTDARVEFSTQQASGWAVGVNYAGKSNMLILSSQIHVALSGANAAVIEADRGLITGDPREIVLDRPHLDREGGVLQADRAVFHLGADNNVESVLATGNVTTETRLMAPVPTQGKQAPEVRGRADQAEFELNGRQNLLQAATLMGNVHFEQTGPQPMQGDARRVVLELGGQNRLQKVHAVDGARLTQRTLAVRKPGTNPVLQDFNLTAPIIDFNLIHNVLRQAETSGPAQITITASREAGPVTDQSQRTVVTAGKFEANFDSAEGKNHLVSLHGAPDVRIVSSTPGEPDRVSTSDSVVATFRDQGGIESVTQLGNVVYSDGQTPDKPMRAWANTARYTPDDQMLLLAGNARVSSGAMETTAQTIRINRATGDALADGDVKSTYNDLKEQPNGALLASSSPIHVTARSMTAHSNPGVALYSGSVRLWQDANLIEAPSIQFDRDRRFVTAQGTAAAPVLTTLVQASQPQPQRGKAEGNVARTSPINITATRLSYADTERRVHYEGKVAAKGVDFTASANTVDAFLLARSQAQSTQFVAGPGQLDRMVAQGDVIIQQRDRRAVGEKLVYTTSDDKFVLTGGPPCIFDAEQGKITGVSLTFFRRDDRVLVEGEADTPVVTQTRVAR